MSRRDLKNRKRQLFLQGLSANLNASELHEFVDLAVRVNRSQGRRVLRRRRLA